MIIEQAKGVVAQHFGVRMNAAFDRLRRYARHHNQPLAELARRIVDRELDLDVLTSGTALSARPSPSRRHEG